MMAITLKQGAPHGNRVPAEVRDRVATMLDEIAAHGERAVRDYSAQLDGWNPPDFRLAPARIDALCGRIDPALARRIDAAATRIGAFARAQLASIRPLEVEVAPGSIAGHRLVPVRRVGAYIPAGRYPLISSALMSILTAKVAGVDEVIAMTAPSGPEGIHLPTLYAMRLAGVDEVYVLGGVQAMAAMALGALPGLAPVDMLVGAGNAYVAEAKRQLFGQVGIDLLAGPTEIAIIADETADPALLAVDLLSQAEHGPTSPALLITTSSRVGAAVLAAVEAALADWPTAAVAGHAWRDCGSVVVAEDAEEAVRISDAFAPEHLELQVADLAWYEQRLRNYGALFVGRDTTVTFGDKAAGPNHTLPTGHAARYTGGLWGGSFLKVLTYERLTPEAAYELAEIAGDISEAEGLLGHAIAARARQAPKR